MFLKMNLKIEKSMHNLYTSMLSDYKAKTSRHYNPKYKKDSSYARLVLNSFHIASKMTVAIYWMFSKCFWKALKPRVPSIVDEGILGRTGHSCTGRSPPGASSPGRKPEASAAAQRARGRAVWNPEPLRACLRLMTRVHLESCMCPSHSGFTCDLNMALIFICSDTR